MNSGSQANYTGSGLERFIEQLLQDIGFAKIDGALLFRNRKHLSTQGNYYARFVYVGDSLFEGKKRIVDFFLVNAIFPEGLIIECKWQETEGSAEEKLPHLVLCTRKTGIPTIIVLDGDGFTLGAKKYLKTEVDGLLLRAVWGMSDFQKARNTGFFGTGILPSHRGMKQAETGDLWEGIV